MVCPKPMDIRCEPANPEGPGSATGRCGPDVGGKYYSCDQGAACKDMKVATKCTEGTCCSQNLYLVYQLEVWYRRRLTNSCFAAISKALGVRKVT